MFASMQDIGTALSWTAVLAATGFIVAIVLLS
jgi:hypothetical protein